MDNNDNPVAEAIRDERDKLIVESLKDAKPLEGVIYSDGGCRAMEPNNPASRGYAGWGMHGYIYNREAPKVGAGAKKGVPSPKGYDLKGSGKGTITVLKYVDAFASIAGEGTNNIAELTAAMEAIKFATSEGLSRLCLITDSKYTVQSITEWIGKWKANGWTRADGTPIANRAIIQELDHYISMFKAAGGKLVVEWVRGHNGDLGNTLADRYANRAVLSLKEGRKIEVHRVSEAKGYWKAGHERNRMLSLANWYFTTSKQMDRIAPDGRHIYYMGDIRDSEEFFGKRISDATFSIVYLKEPEPVLEDLREHFVKLSKGTMQGLIASDLRSIFLADVYDALMEHGEDLLVLNRNRQSIEHMDRAKDGDKDGIELGHEIRPTRLAFTAVNVMETLEGILNDYLSPKESSKIRVTDITDVLYERTEAKNKVTVKLQPTVTGSTRSLDVPVTYHMGGSDAQKEVCLTLGQDLPDRNTLAALAMDGVKAAVVTWPESAQAFRFATIIEADGDVGIWSGPYANLQLVDKAGA